MNCNPIYHNHEQYGRTAHSKTDKVGRINNKVGMLLRLFLFMALGIMAMGILDKPDLFAATSTQMPTFEGCLNNTDGEGACKDCCDCLENPEERRICRDNCPNQNFSANTDIVSISAPSIQGPDGDYSYALALGREQTCKQYCDESDDLSCGDRKFCRDACHAAFGNEPENGEAPPPDPANPDDSNTENNISISQAISDEAQMTTIAFDALAFLTGDRCSDTFFPPGKVSDFFGFQYMRDITPNGFGHNTEFAGRIADNVLSILTEDQVESLVSLANEQASQIDEYGYQRFVLIDGFRRLLENDLPGGTSGLDLESVKSFSADLYEIDGEISTARAEVIGGIVTELTDSQKEKLTILLDTLNALFEAAGEGGSIPSEDWPQASPVDLSGLTVTDGRVLVSTYATQLFSWYLGSVEGDTYFCPERHGTYFGSFYLKDIPPISSTEAVTINENITAELGREFLAILDSSQRNTITTLVDIQRDALEGIVSTRRMIAEKLRSFMTGVSVDKSELMALMREYGAYDGEIVYHYATQFADVGHTLTDGQADSVQALRIGYYEQFPDYQKNPLVYDCSGAWLYAAPVAMPDIVDTDFLFGMNDTTIASADDCLTFDASLNLTVKCCEFNGEIYAFELQFMPSLTGLYWQLNEDAMAPGNERDSCLSFGSDMSLSIDCLEFDGASYRFTLKNVSGQSESKSGVIWMLDPSSIQQFD